MTYTKRASAASPSRRAGVTVSAADVAGLLFIAEMYAVQLDQLGLVLGVGEREARSAAARWVARGLAQTGRLGPGPRWTWLTRPGLRTCGLRYSPAQPPLARLAHIRAVAAVRLALQDTATWNSADAHWRSERRMRSRFGGRVGVRDHLPDAEVFWPDVAGAGAVSWAGECWAIEAELTAKTVIRTTAIMRDLLVRTGDYGCPAAQAADPVMPPRHARAIYLCSRAAYPTATRARDGLGDLAARVEIRGLPPTAYLAAAGESHAGGTR